LHTADVTIDLRENSVEVHHTNAEDWRVTLIDTGAETGTAGRLRRVRPYLNNETFAFTYGDGVANIDITKQLAYHRSQKTLATLAAVQPPGRFGAFKLSEESGHITSFREKPVGDGAWINGGYFLLEPAAIDYVTDDAQFWEQAPLENLADNRQLSAYKHLGFWHAMDTLRDKQVLQAMWEEDKAPWKIW